MGSNGKFILIINFTKVRPFPANVDWMESFSRFVNTFSFVV